MRGKVKGVYYGDGHGEGYKYALGDALYRNELCDLTDKSHGQYREKVFGAVFRIAAALGDHVAVYGKGNSANDSENEHFREENKSDMIYCHCDKSNNLKCITAEHETASFRG